MMTMSSLTALVSVCSSPPVIFTPTPNFLGSLLYTCEIGCYGVDRLAVLCVINQLDIREEAMSDHL